MEVSPSTNRAVFALYPRTRIVRIAVASLYAVEVITIAIGFGLSVPNLVYDEYCTVVDSPITFLVAACVLSYPTPGSPLIPAIS
jgi:hypothetical protein